MDSTFKGIYKMWKAHIEFNRWEVKGDAEENNPSDTVKYKRVNIDELTFL